MAHLRAHFGQLGCTIDGLPLTSLKQPSGDEAENTGSSDSSNSSSGSNTGGGALPAATGVAPISDHPTPTHDVIGYALPPYEATFRMDVANGLAAMAELNRSSWYNDPTRLREI